MDSDGVVQEGEEYDVTVGRITNGARKLSTMQQQNSSKFINNEDNVNN